MASTDTPVAVGVKDLVTDAGAVRMAASEAAATGRSLHVIHAFMWPLELPPGGSGEEREQAERIVADAAAQAREQHRGLVVTPEVVDGDTIEVLLRTAARASMLVLGSDDPTGPNDPTASVSFQVAARAAGPVLCARGSGAQSGPVVVGMDGSPDASVGLSAAVEEARRRKADLVVVHAEDATCGETVTAGDVPVEHRRVEGPAGQALIAASAGAQLVVVGAQGDRPTPLGPVTQAVLRHADCPVLVARQRHVPAQARISGRRPGKRSGPSLPQHIG